MAELGQTDDPVALIPGDPGQLDETVTSLAQYAVLLQEAGRGLHGIDTSSGWSGPAADKFHEVYQVQPARWMQAGDAFESAARALYGYAYTLSWAQQQAARAIDVWDSGTANHQAAADVLTSARDQLTRAGDAAADAVDKAASLAPAAPGFWSQVGHDLLGFGDDLLHGAETFGADAVNALASLGNATIHDPHGLAATVGGASLAALGAAGDVGGTLVAATGVGAVPGAAINAASTGAVLAGTGLAATGATSIIRDALGPGRVTLMQSSSQSGGGGGDEPEGGSQGGTSERGSWVDGVEPLSSALGQPVLDRTITTADGTPVDVFGTITRSGDAVTVRDMSMYGPEGPEGEGLVGQVGADTIRSAGKQLLQEAAPSGIRQVTFSGTRLEGSGLEGHEVNLTVYYDDDGNIKWRPGS